VERADRIRIERVINRELAERFAAVEHAVLLGPGDDPQIEPGQLMVRVFIPPPAEAGDYQQALTAWQDAHRTAMEEFRRELSLRLPAARLLEFTFTDPGADTPRITMPDDGTLAAEQLSGREIVTKALALLRANYVYPEVAEQAATAVEARLEAGEYDELDEIALVELLTQQLREITDDKHLGVRLGGGGPGGPGPRGPGPNGPGEPGPGGPGGPGPGGPGGRGRPRLMQRVLDPDDPANHEARRLAMRQLGRLSNFGIHRVERLAGNVGYLDVRGVPDPAIAGPAITAAMELVAGTHALIIDLRRNHGGSPDGVVFWCSYLFPEHPATHLNDIFHADTGETRQFWALPYVPGTRYLDRPVYVLTSSHTFSGGEDFAYTLQALDRAQVIGETTGGGAHPTRGFPISMAVHIAIPFARSINPVTGTNWQGTGVVPDIAVPEAQAYDTAYAQALRHVLAMEDQLPPIADEARDALAALPSPDPAGVAASRD
jgi:Peptidase family S41/N-terminal domain of Peptidase_S41 in eukaryotic IRBP